MRIALHVHDLTAGFKIMSIEPDSVVLGATSLCRPCKCMIDECKAQLNEFLAEGSERDEFPIKHSIYIRNHIRSSNRSRNYNRTMKWDFPNLHTLRSLFVAAGNGCHLCNLVLTDLKHRSRISREHESSTNGLNFHLIIGEQFLITVDGSLHTSTGILPYARLLLILSEKTG